MKTSRTPTTPEDNPEICNFSCLARNLGVGCANPAGGFLFSKINEDCWKILPPCPTKLARGCVEMESKQLVVYREGAADDLCGSIKAPRCRPELLLLEEKSRSGVKLVNLKVTAAVGHN
ncbi:hypothetical protein CEXT_326991 [Caerostris extrusa]|uniref:Uncharacterized protein n=1 Tax=Caerostris extrusa TaxID=172846 RepID=A0AAV4STK6_CAEEX|nr:hypothetical protein CEXT_326991 [Caerostris extrusa]